MGHQLDSFVSRFKSLKKGVGNKFLTPFNSHFMLMPIIAIIEFLGIAVAFFVMQVSLCTIPLEGEVKGWSMCILWSGLEGNKKRRREAFFFSWLNMG